MIRNLTALGCFALLLSAFAPTGNAGDLKSESKVKATATATKIDDKGAQTVTIQLEITKGWHIYANPVNHDTLAGAQTRVKITAKEKVKTSVNYPAGKVHVDKTEKYDIYDGKVTIQANVQRMAGDRSPLDIVIDVQACNDFVCLIGGKIKLQIP